MGTRKPLVLVRGGGDIASGTIYRLKRAGYPLMVSEIAIPTMIRRSVCYGNAVHAGQMDLEHRQAYYVPMKEALAMAYTKNIPSGLRKNFKRVYSSYRGGRYFGQA